MKHRKQDAFTLPARKLFAVLFTLFFLLYLQYRPYDGMSQSGGVMHTLFSLYFLVINQTLGIVHEGGHGVCYILHCPQFITALNGTLFQWGMPLFVGFYYKRRGNLLGFYISLFVLAISMDYTAWYISTSNEGLHVPAWKSFLGVDGYHDFNYMLSSLGLLSHYHIISIMIKVASMILIFYAYLKVITYTLFVMKPDRS